MFFAEKWGASGAPVVKSAQYAGSDAWRTSRGSSRKFCKSSGTKYVPSANIPGWFWNSSGTLHNLTICFCELRFPELAWGTSGGPVGRQWGTSWTAVHIFNVIRDQGKLIMYYPFLFPGDFEILAGLCATLPPVFVSCNFLNHCGAPVGRQLGRQWGTSPSTKLDRFLKISICSNFLNIGSWTKSLKSQVTILRADRNWVSWPNRITSWKPSDNPRYSL